MVSDIPDGYKRCNKCGEIKSFFNFYNDIKSKDGKATICKSCDKIRRKTKRNEINKYKDVIDKIEDIPDGYKKCKIPPLLCF